VKALLKNLAAMAVLATTAALLVADSAKECRHAAQDVTFDVGHNTCGQPGILRVNTAEDQCILNVEVEERTGLPATGDVYESGVDLRQGGNWYLADTNVPVTLNEDGRPQLEDAGSGATVAVNRTCEVQREGEVLRLKCTARKTDLANEQVYTCEAVLTPR